VRGDANFQRTHSSLIAPRAALDTSRGQTQRSLTFKKRMGVQGEAAQKLKGIFGLLRHYNKVSAVLIITVIK